MKIKKPAIADTGTGNQAIAHRAYQPKGKHDPEKHPAQSKSKTVSAEAGSYEAALGRTMKAATVPGVPFAGSVSKKV